MEVKFVEDEWTKVDIKNLPGDIMVNLKYYFEYDTSHNRIRFNDLSSGTKLIHVAKSRLVLIDFLVCGVDVWMKTLSDETYAFQTKYYNEVVKNG